MKRERIIEFVNGSEEEVAYLRLLLRKASSMLTDKWRLRRDDDSHVDLVVIHDVSDLVVPIGAGAARRVRLIDSVFGAAGMEAATWPLTPEQISSLLNRTAVPGELPAPVAGPVIQQNVYDDIFESDLPERWRVGEPLDANAPLLDFNTAWVPPPVRTDSDLTWQAEQLFRRDPHPDHKETLAAVRLDDAIGIEATDGTTVRGGSRKDLRDARGLAGAPQSLTIGEANQQHQLAAYLNGRLLPGPARIDTGDLLLTLDPRNRHYYAKGALCIFEYSCQRLLRRGDWQVLSAAEFATVKEQLDARPYAPLQWLCAYLDVATLDASFELHADGRYRLIQSIDLQRDYPAAARVARELEQRCTLAAASTAAGVPLDQVRRIAAAFDAIGMLIPD